ncbi:MAG: TonB-dependent receptor [Bacteroidales bacterium]|nr:TonB-dependent receptor [Bacteroidales bacterium]MCF8455615.1 TonB-dependent receptor [Bacteroidales bacterium]
MKIVNLFILLIFSAIGLESFGQNATLYGSLKDERNRPVEKAEIFLFGYPSGTTSNAEGEYEFSVPSNEKITVYFKYLGYKIEKFDLELKPGERKKINVHFKVEKHEVENIDIFAEQERSMNMTRLDPKLINVLPDASGGIEGIVKTFPGVSSNNELSSQYSVRGGNFDENLVYVNDIEVYRPFLIRSGQQEGLSFINADMVSSILFSAGGFEAKYGDKMSSVLDIKYKKPTEFGASASASLMGGSFHLEGSTDNHRLTHISGFRYKSNQYILKSMDTQGDYQPTFIDFQTYWTFDVTDKFEVNFLGNFAQNKYLFIPTTRETSFGTVHEALKLKIYFDGKELNQFTTFTGALAAHYKPNLSTKLSLTASAYQTREEETFDILGQYYLNELDNQLGSDNLGDSLMNLGIGTFLNHGRNYLDASVLSLSHKGYITNDQNFIQWGAKFQHEKISNDLNEWQMLDSAGYSLPYSDTAVNLFSTIITDANLDLNRVTAYLQNTYSFERDSVEYSFTAGIRSHFSDLNNELLLSPRVNFSFKPNWKKDYLFRFATGYYYQPPFFKELKKLNGEINTNIQAQKSVHFVVGSDYQFKAWNRDFKFVAEAYYKHLENLIPYDVDNVRIRYYGNNNAKGYAMGIDFKVNGQFVNGAESWASLSFMRTREVINGIFTYNDTDSTVMVAGNTDYIPRPTDQIVNFGLFFQDYLPGNPSYKMQLNLLYGAGLPFGPPNANKAILDWPTMPAYRRVDIGFSKVLKSEDKLMTHSMLKHFKSLWIAVEVFNLLDINNTISYVWITDIRNQQYAVPNYLTSRRLNVKLIARF